jgi:hypothetical protein
MRRPLKHHLAAAVTLTASALLAGCGPSVDKAFANCAETAYKLALSGNRTLLNKDAAKLFEKSARATAEQQCSIIRDECRRDAQSEDCKQLIRQYSK